MSTKKLVVITYLDWISKFPSVYTISATVPPWWFSGTKYKTEIHFVVFTIQSVSRRAPKLGFVKFSQRLTYFAVFMSQSVSSRRAPMARLCLIPCEVQSRIMISAQTICVSSSRIPQPGIRIKSAVSLSRLRRPGGLKRSSGVRKGRGYRLSTLAIKQASSFFSSAEDVSGDEVLAKETGVRDFTGTKNVEFMDPISPAKLVSTVDDQLPSLLSMVIDSLPPLQLSKYIHEAKKRLHQYLECYPDVNSWDSYYHVGLSAASYLYPGVIGVDHLVAMAINYPLLFLLDDLYFDTPDEFRHDQYGISYDALDSLQKIQEYLDHLDAVFSQQVKPRNPTPLSETLMWESGQEILELSNLEWFTIFVTSIMECHRVSIASHIDIVQGHNLCFKDLESYSAVRARNTGGTFTQSFIEFAKDSYIPGILKMTLYLKNVTMATSIYVGFANAIFSYHKDSLIEHNPRNLITVLMECKGKPFVQIVHMATSLVKTYAYTIMDLEFEAWNSTLRIHL